MWLKVDDRMHAHRKTRAVLRSHPEKARDAAPFGLWLLAGSWAAQNDTDGWVPVDELERFDTDWEAYAKRLIAADYWWPEQRDGEEGYGFVHWSEWNTSRERQSADGKYGNHERWHVRRGVVKDDCDLCPTDPESATPSVPDIPPDSGTDRGGDSESIALPDPTRTRSRPDPNPVGPASAVPRATKRATQRPADFTPTEGHIALAQELGVNLRAEWQQFCDHHDAKGSTFKDWPAALRTWIRNAAKFQARRSGGGRNDIDWDAAMDRAREIDEQRGIQ